MMTYTDYEHHVKYYELDGMGIVHHSNYIRWMEEARVDMLDQIGMSYRSIEEAGIVSPVLGISCEYKQMTRFDDRIVIHTEIKEYSGMRLTVSYEMRNKADGKVCFTGESKHCFLTKEGRPTTMKKVDPQWHRMLSELAGRTPEEI